MNDFFAASLTAGMVLSFAAYFLGDAVKKKLKLVIFNPILIGSLIVIAFLVAFGVDFESYDYSAKYISFFLTPATVCLAIPLYRQIEALKKNAAAVMTGVFFGSLSNLAAVFLISFVLGFDHEKYVTLLPKSITAAIAMSVSKELGGMVPVTVLALLITGLSGNILGESVCRIFRIKNPISRGLAIGTASHAIGTTKAMEMGETEGAMSGLAIAVAGLITVVLAPLFAGLI